MDINKLVNQINNIKLHEKGTATMWTNDYMSKQLLCAHLDTNNNYASRKGDTIDKTIDWITKEYGKSSGEVLDLGCGPGLYTERFANRGYSVTGIDFSSNSIQYAKNSAKEKNLSIDYRCMNYLDLDYEGKFDLIIMIYCDFCVLSAEEREIFLHNVYRALKKGGIFIFDAHNELSLKNHQFINDWEVSGGNGFWQKDPYICLSQKRHYENEKIILNQHIVIDENCTYKTYRFWEYYYQNDDILKILDSHGFTDIAVKQNLLVGDGICNDQGVTFYKVIK